jgi:hypothetical protein
MEETVIATQPGSTVSNFAPHPIGSPARGAGSFAAEGLNLSANQAYQLSAITSPLRLSAARRERIHPFRLSRFCLHQPVGQQKKCIGTDWMRH